MQIKNNNVKKGLNFVLFQIEVKINFILAIIKNKDGKQRLPKAIRIRKILLRFTF